ncbi:MAG: diaminopimelate epimerase [Planctomycetota bacterium]
MNPTTLESRIEPRPFSGTGNVFAIVDAMRTPPPADPAALARALCSREADGRRLDGVLVVRPSSKGADCAMEIYNSDGSRAETCGNGLRCVAKWIVDKGYVRGRAFTIASDAGIATAEVEQRDGRVTRARVGMGRPRSCALRESLDVEGSTLAVANVDMGNPHCVLTVADERNARVETLGPKIETHPRFPRGTNVGFLASRGGRLHLRVWERGVGETMACGSGACAAAWVAVERGLATWPVRLVVPGGELEVDRAEDGTLELSGAVEELDSPAWQELLRTARA